jgi:RNA polymerase sigma factor (sigma-70 family)
MKPPSTFALASAFQTPTIGPVLRDQFLLAKLRTGDEHAWRKVFPDLHQLASGVAYNIVLSIDDAQEIAMGCLAEISRPGCIGQVGIQTLERLRGYLVGIVRNKAKDFLRRKTAQRRGEGNVWNFSDLATEDGKSPVMDADSGDDLHAQVESREAQKQILEVLDTLPEKERILVKGFYLQGNTYQELADMHGIPTGTIGVYLSRALTKLRSRLKPMRA